MATSLGTIYGSVRLRTDTLTSDATSIKGIFADIRAALSDAFSNLDISERFSDAVAGIPATTEEAMSGVADAVRQGTSEAATAAEAGMGEVADAVQTGTADAADSAETGAARISEIFSSLRDGLGGIASGISERVSGAFAAVGESGDALAEHLGGVKEGLGKLGEGFKGALEHATEFAAGMLEFQALNGAMSAVGDFASNLIGMNSTFESLHQQLTSITGSSGAADKLLDWVKDFGQQIPDTTEHLAESVVTIQSLGLNAQQVIPSIANVAAAMGTDLPTASKAFADAFEGRFQMMQMELHVTKGQLEEFGMKIDKTGKVDSKSLVEAFEKLQKAKFGDAIKNQMGTLQGQLSNLTDRVQFFAMSMGKPLFDLAKQGLGALFGFLDAHKKDIDTFAEVVGGGLANAFKFLGTAVTGVVGFFATHAAAVDALKAAFIGLGGALLTFAASVVIPLIPGAIAALAGLAGVVGSVVVAAAPFIAVGLAIAGLALAIKHAYDTSAPFRQVVQEIGAKMREFGQHVLQAGQALLTKLSPFIKDAVSHIQQFAAELGTRVGPALINVFHFLEMVGGFVAGVFTAIWPTLKNVIAGVWEAIQGVIEVAWSIISGIFKVILDVIGGKWGQAWNDLLEMLKGVWDGILKLLGGLLPAIGSILGGLGQLLLNILVAAWNGIKTGIGNLLGALGDFIGGKIHEWLMRFQLGVSAIQALLHEGFEKVKEIITAPIRFVAGLFKWLFDHNTYFHDLVVRIQTAFNNAKAFITEIWTTIKNWLGDRWQDIQKDAQIAWALVQDHIVKPVQQAIATLQAKLTDIRNWIIGKWNEVKQDAQNAWDHFVSAITGVVDRVKTAISNVISSITTPITNLATTALQWGQNLIQQFINGIQNMAGKAGDAAKNVVGNVAKFLGFHSPAEEGPGADADKWAPRLMQMFAEGVVSGTPAVASAASRAAQAVRNGLTSNATLPYGAVGAGAGGAAGGGVGAYIEKLELTVNVEADEADGSPEAAGRAFGTTFGSAFGQALKSEMAQRGHRPG